MEAMQLVFSPSSDMVMLTKSLASIGQAPSKHKQLTLARLPPTFVLRSLSTLTSRSWQFKFLTISSSMRVTSKSLILNFSTASPFDSNLYPMYIRYILHGSVENYYHSGLSFICFIFPIAYFAYWMSLWSGSSLLCICYIISATQLFKTLATSVSYHMRQDKNKSLLSDFSPSVLEQKHEEHHIKAGKYIKSLIFGGLDGAVNALAVILGGVGSGASPMQIMAFGISVMIGDGLGMGLGDYLSAKAEKEFIASQQRREQQEFQNKFDAEASQVEKIYTKKGYSQDEAKKLVQLFATNDKVFVNIMMLEELGLVKSETKPIVNGLITFLSFALFGLFPLVPYIIGAGIMKDRQSQYMPYSLGIAGVLFFGLGYAKAAIVKFNPWKSAVETLVMGSIAVAVGYGIGLLFQA